MTDSRNSLPRTLYNLFLAVLNATLILVALCLWLGWQLVSSVDDLTSSVAEHARVLKPVREDIRSMTSEIAGIREDIGMAQAGSIQLDELAKQRLLRKLASYDERLEASLQTFDNLAGAPARLIDQAINKAADEITTRLTGLRGCVPAPEEQSSS